MRVLVCGCDGYIGAPLFFKLSESYDVWGVDNQLRRRLVNKVGGRSVIPIPPFTYRFRDYPVFKMDITNYSKIKDLIKTKKPDTIVNLAQQPSAPYSHLGVHEAAFTQRNNIIGLLNILWAVKKYSPDTHIITLGTMGEHDLDQSPVPESTSSRRDPTRSFYHLSKIQASLNAVFAAEVWGLRITDIMQGIVYGCNPFGYETRFDTDPCFGTFVNQKTAQALVEDEITVCGGGEQARAYLSITDSIRAIELLIKHPHESGYRMVNQFTSTHTCNEIAEYLSKITGKPVVHLPNPRVEKEQGKLEVEMKVLKKLKFKPAVTVYEEIKKTLGVLEEYKDRIKGPLKPEVSWR